MKKTILIILAALILTVSLLASCGEKGGIPNGTYIMEGNTGGTDGLGWDEIRINGSSFIIYSKGRQVQKLQYKVSGETITLIVNGNEMKYPFKVLGEWSFSVGDGVYKKK